jgi:hypothetical protein
MLKDEDLKQMDLDTVEKEIKSRYDLLEMMVGTLYPSIIWAELGQLFERQSELWPKNNVN